jgi:hypothetical protein
MVNFPKKKRGEGEGEEITCSMLSKTFRFSRFLTGIGKLYVCPSENIAHKTTKCKYS